MTDKHPYQYLCSNDHEIFSGKPLDKCLAYDNGSPCEGELTRVGPGSKTKTTPETT